MHTETLLEGRTHGDIMFPLEVYMVDYLAGEVIFNWHWHHEVEFILMEEGQAEFHIGTQVRTLHSGEAVFIPSGQPHAAYPIKDNPFRFSAIVFNMNLLKSFAYDAIQTKYIDPLQDIESSSLSLIPGHNESEINILKNLKTIIERHHEKKSGFEMIIKGQLYMVFAELISNTPLKPRDLKRESSDHDKLTRLKLVLQYIEEHYNEKLTVYDLASIIQMSEGHFSRFFKSFVRMSPIEYINSLRVDRAAKLLKETNTRIIDISMEVGFDNSSYFIKTFKRLKKCTPSEFRKI